LKRLLLILLTGLLISLGVQGQESRGPNPDPAGKIVKFYPNPATSYITFDLQKNYQKGLTISVFNFLGKKVSETQNVNERTTVQLTDYTRGVYIYYLTDATGKVLDTGKFQVSK
jgi:hypothetical protein